MKTLIFNVFSIFSQFHASKVFQSGKLLNGDGYFWKLVLWTWFQLQLGLSLLDFVSISFFATISFSFCLSRAFSSQIRLISKFSILFLFSFHSLKYFLMSPQSLFLSIIYFSLHISANLQQFCYFSCSACSFSPQICLFALITQSLSLCLMS